MSGSGVVAEKWETSPVLTGEYPEGGGGWLDE